MITTFKIFEKQKGKKWYYNFVDIDKIDHYYYLSKEYNIETHFFEPDDLDVFGEDLIPMTVFTDEYTYERYYSDFSETEENFDDIEIKDIKYWLKINKYNL